MKTRAGRKDVLAVGDLGDLGDKARKFGGSDPLDNVISCMNGELFAHANFNVVRCPHSCQKGPVLGMSGAVIDQPDPCHPASPIGSRDWLHSQVSSRRAILQ